MGESDPLASFSHVVVTHVYCYFAQTPSLGFADGRIECQSAVAGAYTAAIRTVVSQVIPIAGTVILGLYVIILSSALLPTVKVMIALILLAGMISWLLRGSFIRVYSIAQVALVETFAQQPELKPESAPAAFPSLLREADLEMTSIQTNSPGAGKFIRELELRTRTGASIVGIERGGSKIINPSPDEELQAGDQILLLGTRAQLDAEKAIFSQAVPFAPHRPELA